MLGPCYGECNATSHVHRDGLAGRKVFQYSDEARSGAFDAARSPSSNLGLSMSTITQSHLNFRRSHVRSASIGVIWDSWRAPRARKRLPKEPLFIYTMGKVGTMSYQQALRVSDRFNVFAIHFLNPRFRQEFVLGKETC